MYFFVHTIERRKRRETGAWTSKCTNTYTNKGSVKKTSRPNALQTPSPGFDGLTAGTIVAGGWCERVHAHLHTHFVLLYHHLRGLAVA